MAPAILLHLQYNLKLKVRHPHFRLQFVEPMPPKNGALSYPNDLKFICSTTLCCIKFVQVSKVFARNSGRILPYYASSAFVYIFSHNRQLNTCAKFNRRLFARARTSDYPKLSYFRIMFHFRFLFPLSATRRSACLFFLSIYWHPSEG